MLERSGRALDHAQRARDELYALATAKVDSLMPLPQPGQVAIGMDAESQARQDDFLYRFRSTVALLMAVGTTIDDEVGSAASKGWWQPLLQPHASQLMKLRNPALKQTNPAASPKHDLQGRLVRGKSGAVQVAEIRIVASRWTWDSGPYAGQDVMAVIDLFLDLLRNKVLPEADRLLARP